MSDDEPLSPRIGCVLTYEVLGWPGVHGQTVGADGAGIFAEVFLGEPGPAAAKAMKRINDMESKGVRLGPFHLVADEPGYTGAPMLMVIE